jgi:hypothetical protein
MNRCAVSSLRGLMSSAMLVVAAVNVVVAAPFSLDSDALATLNFEGVDLPTTSESLLEKFPAATLEQREDDQKHGMNCYLVTDFPNADTARFYFCDDRLYQFEASYSLERLEKQGGAQSLLRKLIKSWGPVDHAGESRWTWKRAMYSRRADFYAWPDRAKLTITELGLMPIVTARRNEPIEPTNIPGF